MKRPRRQYFVVLPQGEKYPMQRWIRKHPEHIPQGVGGVPFPKLIIGLKQNGWKVKETDTEVRLIPPTKEGEGDLESVIELLQEAKSLIMPFGAWTQGVSARTASGDYADLSDPNATRFCLEGALHRAKLNLYAIEKIISRAYEIVNQEIRATAAIDRLLNPKNTNHASSIIGYNDTQGRTQREVLDVLDNAVFQAEMKEFEQYLSEIDDTVGQAVEYVSSRAPTKHRIDSREGHKPRRSRF